MPTIRNHIPSSIIIVSLLSASGVAAHEMAILDSLDHEPLPAASVLDRNGSVISQSDKDGNAYISENALFPIEIRYLGYETARLNELTDTVIMNAASYNLNEITVANDKIGSRTICYAREYTTMVCNGDTLTVFSEYMVDYMLPFNDKAKGFKSQTKPRVLNNRSRVRRIFADHTRPDSIYDSPKYKPIWSSLAEITYASIEEPMSMRGKEVADTIIFTGKTGTRYNKQNGRMTVFTDELEKETNHVLTPGILKLLGMTLDITRNDVTALYPIKDQPIYNYYDMTAISYNYRIVMRGKMFKHFFRSKNPIQLQSLIEIYPVDHYFLNAKESKELKKEVEKIDFIIPPFLNGMP